jgi:hypothetical protein
MSLSFTNYADFNGTPVAHLIDEDKPKEMKKILYMYDRAVPDGQPVIELNTNQSFEKAVDTNQEREVMYVSGMSGAGKSYYCKQYIEKYHKKWPKRDVYVFSSLSTCNTLDKLKFLKRIKIMEAEFMNRVLTASDFKESLVLFDDIDVISNKKIKLKVYEIMNSILQIGRHHKVTALVTSHASTNGNDTKIILNESTAITLFPKASGNRGLLYIADAYLGLDTKQAKALRNIDGRFITVIRNHPRCIFSLKKAYMLSNN